LSLHKVSGQKGTENYYIYTPTKEIFAIYPTFSLITTAANPLIEEIHNEKKRMLLNSSQLMLG